jgi:hypothetical protein
MNRMAARLDRARRRGDRADGRARGRPESSADADGPGRAPEIRSACRSCSPTRAIRPPIARSIACRRLGRCSAPGLPIGANTSSSCAGSPPDVFRHARGKMIRVLALSGIGVGLRAASAAVIVLFVDAQQKGRSAEVLGFALPSEPTLANLALWGGAGLLFTVGAVGRRTAATDSSTIWRAPTSRTGPGSCFGTSPPGAPCASRGSTSDRGRDPPRA